MYNRVSIRNLTENLAPFIDWKIFLNKYLQTYDSKEVISNDDTIVVLGVEYFQNLTDLINEYRSDSEKLFTLKFYLFMPIIKFSMPLLSSEFRKELFKVRYLNFKLNKT